MSWKGSKHGVHTFDRAAYMREYRRKRKADSVSYAADLERGSRYREAHPSHRKLYGPVDTDETRRVWRENNQPLIKAQRMKQRDKIRSTVLELKSCGCSLCGYNKCSDAIEFHHVSADKEGALSRASSMGAVYREAAKCIVVCANCHREIHAGQIEGYEHVERARTVPEGYDDLPLLRLVRGS